MPQYLVSDGIWTEIARLGKAAKVRRAAIAYVTDMTSLSFGLGDTLIVDASEGTIACGSTDAQVLARAVDNGARVYSLPGLHAKLMRLDDTVVVGSGNLSPNSRDRLIEATVISDDKALVAQVDKFIDALEKDATRITDKDIRRLLAIVVARTFGPNSTRKSAVTVGKPSTWILGLPDRVEWDGPEGDVESAKREIESQETADSEVDDFYWTKKHSFAKNAREGDLVISIYRPEYNNRAATQIRVYKPAWIRRIVPAGNKPDMGFVTVNPKSAGAEAVGWPQFQTMADAAGIKRLSPDCGIRITDRQRRMLEAHWQEPVKKSR